MVLTACGVTGHLAGPLPLRRAELCGERARGCSCGPCMGMGVGRMLVGPGPGPAASWVWERWAAGRPPRVSQPRRPPKLPAAVDRVERGPRERQLVGQVLSCARRVAPRAPPPAWADASPGNMWLSGRLQNIRGLAVAVVATRSFPQRAGRGLSCRFRHILVISSKRGMRSREGGGVPPFGWLGARHKLETGRGRARAWSPCYA